MNVFLIAAISIDGFISPEALTNSAKWTSDGDKKFFGERTKQAKVMVMGSTTFGTIGRPLPGRRTVVMSSKPKPPEYSQFDDSQVMFTTKSPADIVEQLAAEGYDELAVCGGSNVYTQFMKARLIQTVYLTVEPIMFGSGVPLFNDSLGGQKLSLIEQKKIDTNTLLLTYSVAQ